MRSILLMLVCAAGTLVAQISAQYLPQTPDGKPDLAGVWVVYGSTNLPDDLPYRPEALKLWQEHKANLAKDDPATYCLPNGVVRVTSLPYKIVQTAQLVVLLSEGTRTVSGESSWTGEPTTWTWSPIAGRAIRLESGRRMR